MKEWKAILRDIGDEDLEKNIVDIVEPTMLKALGSSKVPSIKSTTLEYKSVRVDPANRDYNKLVGILYLQHGIHNMDKYEKNEKDRKERAKMQP